VGVLNFRERKTVAVSNGSKKRKTGVHLAKPNNTTVINRHNLLLSKIAFGAILLFSVSPVSAFRVGQLRGDGDFGPGERQGSFGSEWDDRDSHC
jgi:hypothetical protein